MYIADVCTHVLCMYSLYACLLASRLLCAFVCVICVQYMRCYVKNYTHAYAHIRALHSLSLTLRPAMYINACSFYGFCWLFRLLLLLLLAFMIHKRCLPFLLLTKKGRFSSSNSCSCILCRHSLCSHTSFSIKLDMVWLGLAWLYFELTTFSGILYRTINNRPHFFVRSRSHAHTHARTNWWQNKVDGNKR